ncbi:hypothetical protein DFJ74DRAFT_18923 [Hyaloraphidium curvatum]|nr:hypothetical protein DFJ74DRAFT_18923 [Hyaloraphidium curvatum]
MQAAAAGCACCTPPSTSRGATRGLAGLRGVQPREHPCGGAAADGLFGAAAKPPTPGELPGAEMADACEVGARWPVADLPPQPHRSSSKADGHQGGGAAQSGNGDPGRVRTRPGSLFGGRPWCCRSTCPGGRIRPGSPSSVGGRRFGAGRGSGFRRAVGGGQVRETCQAEHLGAALSARVVGRRRPPLLPAPVCSLSMELRCTPFCFHVQAWQGGKAARRQDSRASGR